MMVLSGMGIWAEESCGTAQGKKLRASTPTGCKGFTEEMGWLLEDGWDFHTWRWVGKALGKVCPKHRYVDRETGAT